MRMLPIMLAGAALAGCTVNHYEVSQPPPTQPPASHTVAMTYKGPDGFNIAARKANDWCDQHFGDSDVRVVKDDRKKGHATFACQPAD